MNCSTNELPEEFDRLTPVSVPKGSVLFTVGDACEQFVYVLQGKIRVNLDSETGSSVLLYRLNAADTCVLTTSCLLGNDHYCAEATVEEDVSLLLMPAKAFFTSVEQSSSFRTFVFASFSSRLSALMTKIDEVAFRSIDCRLATALLDHAKGGVSVNVTHEFLANEIGSAREVVSRKLAQWHSAMLIEKKRGEIILLSADRLGAIKRAKR